MYLDPLGVLCRLRIDCTAQSVLRCVCPFPVRAVVLPVLIVAPSFNLRVRECIGIYIR